MTAVKGGSNRFVSGVFRPFEVQKMYAIRMDVSARTGTNAALREYARLEYGNDEVAWILAAAKAPRRKAARASFAVRFRIRRAGRARRPVACKGSPRISPTQGSSPG